MVGMIVGFTLGFNVSIGCIEGFVLGVVVNIGLIVGNTVGGGVMSVDINKKFIFKNNI